MGLEPNDFARLERDASSMGTANHGRYLSEAMLAMRDPAFAADTSDLVEAPLRALRLLDVMWGGVHALRPDQRVALNEVGVWLETRLSREPDAKVSTLLVELGWLKRLARHHQSMQEDNRRAGFAMPGRGNQKTFGRRLAEIERRRREALAKAARVEVSERQAVVAEAAKPKGPEALPATLAVQFEDFGRVREVRKAAMEREKKKKEPKDVSLSLVGRDGTTAGVKLVCSTTRTAGMAEVMERVRTTSGAPDWFMVASEMVREVDEVVSIGRLVINEGS